VRKSAGSLRFLLKVLPILCAGLVISACTHTRVSPPASGEALEREGKTEQAVVGYREQLARTPATEVRKHSELQFRIGECLLALDRSTEAFSAFRRAAELDDTNSMAHLRLGQLYMQAGETEQSSEEALIVLRQAGPNPEALGLIGSAASANGNLEVARYFFERAQSLAPTEIKFSLAVAEVYDRMGEGAKARAVLTDATKLRPSSSAPWLALGRIEESDGHVEAAEQDYRRAVEAENTPEANLRMAQFLERSSQPAAAEDVFSKVDRMRSQLPVALADYEFRIGQAALAASRYRVALAPYEKSRRGLTFETLLQKRHGEGSQIVSRLIEAELETAVAERSPQNIAAIGERLEHFRRELDLATLEILRTEVALAQDDIEKADRASAEALQRAPESASAHYVAGVVREREGDFSAARVEWETALEKDSDFIPARLVLAEVELEDGNYKAARKLTVAALRSEPGNRRALVTFARACVGLRDFDAARAISGRLLALVPDAPETGLVAAEIEAAEGNAARALGLYEAALAVDPDTSGAVDGLSRLYAGVNSHRAQITRSMLQIEKDTAELAKASPSSARISAARLEALGRAFAQHKRGEDAERCLEQSLTLDPTRTTAAEWLARLQAQRGDEGAAKKSASHIRRLYPMMAALEADANAQSNAIDLYEAAIHRGDPTGFAANNLAWLYAQRGVNLDRALTLATRAMQLRPADPAFADTLGYVFLRRREYSHAVAALERARELMPDADLGDSIKRHLAEAYLRAGNSDRAATLLAQFR
jgi:tetratricopeptide (TPR) repeat protein